MSGYYLPVFDDVAAKQEIMAPPPGELKQVPVEPSFTADAFDGQSYPCLTKDQEYHVFRQYNYCLFHGMIEQAQVVRNFIVICYLRTVKLAVRRMSYFGVETEIGISEGYSYLFGCIKGFDFRHQKCTFATYVNGSVKFALLSEARCTRLYDERFGQQGDPEGDYLDRNMETADNLSSRKELCDHVRKVIQQLSEEDQRYVKGRWWDQKSGMQLMHEFSCSRSSVGYRKRRILARLRRLMEAVDGI